MGHPCSEPDRQLKIFEFCRMLWAWHLLIAESMGVAQFAWCNRRSLRTVERALGITDTSMVSGGKK